MKSIRDIIAGLEKKEFRGPVKREITNLPKWSERFAFDLRTGSSDEKHMVKLVTACARMMLDMKEGVAPYWLSLLGTSGAGKTYLAKKVFKWHRECGLFNSGTSNERGLSEVVYAREWCWWPQLSRTLKSNDGYGELNDVESATFSVIDEIGADLDKTGHVTNCLATMLCGRVGKWTLITSNRSVDEIQQNIDPRVASRMIRDGSEVVDVNVEDYSLWLRKKKT